MQVSSDRSGSESNSFSPGNDGGFEQTFDISGIDDQSYLKLYLESCKDDYKLINYVNQHCSLYKIVKENNIILQLTNKPDWAYKANCPFPDHRDSSPSFYINKQTNTFHCFGCSRKGGVCQFLACLNRKQTIDIAKEILKNGSIKIDELIKEVHKSYFDSIFPLLDEFSKIHFDFLKENFFSEDAFAYAANVSPIFEFYVKNILKNNNLDIDSLRARLDFCKRKFEEFKD